jgi:hypothetical protein
VLDTVPLAATVAVGGGVSLPPGVNVLDELAFSRDIIIKAPLVKKHIVIIRSVFHPAAR